MIELRQWTKGLVISEPGIYAGLPIEFYHDACTDGPGISSSGLRTIEDKSPAHYFANSYLNPNRLAPEPKSHFTFGHAAHQLFLGESGFKEKYSVRPAKWKDWRKDDAKEWRAEEEMAGRIVLVPEDLEALKGIARSLAAEPLVRDHGILQGKIEHSGIWRDPITGVWLKIRPDVLPESDGIAVDLKTTTDASPDSIQRACLDLGYPMQGALIGMGMEALLGVPMTDFVLCWIEKSPPYAVNISPVEPDWIYWSRRLIRRSIDTFAKCLETNEWPAYQGERMTYMPEWHRKRLERDAECGLLPEVA